MNAKVRAGQRTKNDLRCRLDEDCANVVKQFTSLVSQNTAWLDEYIDSAFDQHSKGSSLLNLMKTPSRQKAAPVTLSVFRDTVAVESPAPANPFARPLFQPDIQKENGKLAASPGHNKKAISPSRNLVQRALSPRTNVGALRSPSANPSHSPRSARSPRAGVPSPKVQHKLYHDPAPDTPPTVYAPSQLAEPIQLISKPAPSPAQIKSAPVEEEEEEDVEEIEEPEEVNPSTSEGGSASSSLEGAAIEASLIARPVNHSPKAKATGYQPSTAVSKQSSPVLRASSPRQLRSNPSGRASPSGARSPLGVNARSMLSPRAHVSSSQKSAAKTIETSTQRPFTAGVQDARDEASQNTAPSPTSSQVPIPAPASQQLSGPTKTPGGSLFSSENRKTTRKSLERATALPPSPTSTFLSHNPNRTSQFTFKGLPSREKSMGLVFGGQSLASRRTLTSMGQAQFIAPPSVAAKAQPAAESTREDSRKRKSDAADLVSEGPKAKTVRMGSPPKDTETSSQPLSQAPKNRIEALKNKVESMSKSLGAVGRASSSIPLPNILPPASPSFLRAQKAFGAPSSPKSPAGLRSPTTYAPPRSPLNKTFADATTKRPGELVRKSSVNDIVRAFEKPTAPVPSHRIPIRSPAKSPVKAVVSAFSNKTTTTPPGSPGPAIEPLATEEARAATISPQLTTQSVVRDLDEDVASDEEIEEPAEPMETTQHASSLHSTQSSMAQIEEYEDDHNNTTTVTKQTQDSQSMISRQTLSTQSTTSQVKKTGTSGAVKSIHLAAQAAKKEQEEKDRRAAVKDAMEQKRRLAAIAKQQAEERQIAEQERKTKEQETADRKRKERDDGASSSKQSSVPVLPSKTLRVKSTKPAPDDANKKRKLEVSTSRTDLKIQAPSRPGSAIGMTQTTQSSSSKMSSAHRTMQIESQKKMSSVKAAPEASSSRNVIRAGASKLQIKRTTATQVPSAASSRLSSQTKSHVTSAVEEEKETYVELPDIDSEYSDSDEEAQAAKAAALPDWTRSPELRQALAAQSQFDPDLIFGAIPPLRMEEIFVGPQKRFRARTSSANWAGPDQLSRMEEIEFAKRMGYRA